MMVVQRGQSMKTIMLKGFSGDEGRDATGGGGGGGGGKVEKSGLTLAY